MGQQASRIKRMGLQKLDIGSMKVHLKCIWKSLEKSMIKFYLDEIAITIGDNSIKVVLSNCYSKTLGAKRIDDSTVRSTDASFRTG